MAAAAAVFAATLAPVPRLAPGEDGHVIVIAPTRQQAQLVFRYCLAFLQESPLLRQRIREVRAEEIVLTETLSSACTVAAFVTSAAGTSSLLFSMKWRTGWTSLRLDPTRKSIALCCLPWRLPGGCSSAFLRLTAESGLFYAKHRDHFGQEGDVLVVQGTKPSLQSHLWTLRSSTKCTRR